VGAVGFSGKAIIVKLGYQAGADASTLLMLRMAMAMPMFVLLAWLGGRGQSPLTTRDWLVCAALGFVGYYFSSLLDFLGLLYISASLERLILYLSPTVVAMLSWLLYKKTLRASQVAAMGLSYLGVLVVFGRDVGSQGSHTALGAMLVLGSAFSYALYLLFSGQVVKRLGSMRLTGLSATFASLFCIAHYAVVTAVTAQPGAASQFTPHVLSMSLINAVFCTVLPVWFVMLAIERIGSTFAAQAGMVGPMVTLVLGWWLLGEAITPWVLLGTTMVLAGVALQSALAVRA
jgi:drug/metabolite transporter (DMT)-like permease